MSSPITKLRSKKIAASVCLVLSFAFGGVAAAADETPATRELARLEGVWSFVQVKFDGTEQLPAGREADRMIIQKDGRYAVVQRPQITHGTVKVDPAPSPKHYDIVIGDGRLKGLSVPAIYELSGDTLTICMPFGGKERPTAVESKPGDHHLFEVFKREQQDVKEALVAAGRRELAGTWQSVSYALDGKKASDDDMKKIQLVFDADGNTKALNDGKVFLASSTKIDPTANPATIDIVFTEGQGKGETALGIYKIENGVLTICRSAPGKARPAEFTSNAGSGLTLMSYRHQAAATKKSFRTGSATQ
ncbi:MAG TPA: TIGR03067 domain-containing protein [Planctomycetaceae bacterium]|nr:TIGR03067 domain-containing protein [Planctomycetaceae bacterium]